MAGSSGGVLRPEPFTEILQVTFSMRALHYSALAGIALTFAIAARAAPLDQSTTLIGRDLRFLGSGYLAVFESHMAKEYGCGVPNVNFLLHVPSKEEYLRTNNADHEIVEIKVGGTVHIEREQTYQYCCLASDGCRPKVAFLASHRAEDGRQITFLAEPELFSVGTGATRPLESYGPARRDGVVDWQGFRETRAFQFADEPVGPAPSDVDEAARRVLNGTPAVRLANARYLAAHGEAALPAELAALKDDDPRVRRAAAEAIAAIGHLDDSVRDALLSAAVIRKGTPDNPEALDAALHLGLRHRSYSLIRSALDAYASVTFRDAQSAPAGLVEAFCFEDPAIAKRAMGILRQYFAVRQGNAWEPNRGGLEIANAFRAATVESKIRMLKVLENVATQRNSTDTSQGALLNGAMLLYHDALTEPDVHVREAAVRSIGHNLDQPVRGEAYRLDLIRTALPELTRAESDKAYTVRDLVRDIKNRYPTQLATLRSTRQTPVTAKEKEPASHAIVECHGVWKTGSCDATGEGREDQTKSPARGKLLGLLASYRTEFRGPKRMALLDAAYDAAPQAARELPDVVKLLWDPEYSDFILRHDIETVIAHIDPYLDRTIPLILAQLAACTSGSPSADECSAPAKRALESLCRSYRTLCDNQLAKARQSSNEQYRGVVPAPAGQKIRPN